nr:hypothetical protein BgiMline_020554 [Biomphalaria glabrata]
MFYLKFICRFFKWSHSQNKVQMYQLFLLTDIKSFQFSIILCTKLQEKIQARENIKQEQCTYQHDEDVDQHDEDVDQHDEDVDQHDEGNKM